MRVWYRRERVVVDPGFGYAVVCAGATLRNDSRNGFANIPHDTVGKDGLTARAQRRVSHGSVDAAYTDIRGGDSVNDALDGAGSRQVHCCQPRMWVFAAHE